MRSAHWLKTARAARKDAGHKCQDCGIGGRLDVHHLTYERIGAELPGDLLVLCRACHDRRHHVVVKSRQAPSPKRAKKLAKQRANRKQKRKVNGVRRVGCPACGALPGAPCKAGHRVTGNHHERVEAAGYWMV